MVSLDPTKGVHGRIDRLSEQREKSHLPLRKNKSPQVYPCSVSWVWGFRNMYHM